MSTIGLSDQAKLTAKAILTQFSLDYNDWQIAFKQPGANQSQLGLQAETIVQQTRDAMTKQLSPEGNSKLIQYVNGKKVTMVVKP